jgi:prefoldin subunit 5
MTEKKKVKVSDRQLQGMVERSKREVTELTNRRNTLRQALIDTDTASIALKDIKSASAKQPLLVSVGGGLFLEAEFTNTKKVKELLAGSILLDRGLDQTVKLLADRRKTIEVDMKAIIEQEAKARKKLQRQTGMLSAGRRSVRQKVRKAREKRKKAKK